MCDTIVALGNSTADNSVIFAKNSDREPNEAHLLEMIPHALHKSDDTVRCTYIEIPQTSETNAVLLAKPFWIWGAEMGANEHGVVIGNEAIFSRLSAGKEGGLIGMDYLRLGLERASTARKALDVITKLLEIYGQSGNCGFSHSIYYHNSYLIADSGEAWVLETVGKQWAAEKVKDIRSISNVITIGSTWDLASTDLVRFALDRGWCRDEKDFDFSRCYSDSLYTRFGRGQERHCRTTDILTSQKGKINLKTAMSLLRDHGENVGKAWTPERGVTNVSVCMHAGFGPIRIDQSTGSMVSRLTSDSMTHWFTGTSAPCTGIFKPVWIDAGLPDQEPAPKGQFDADSLWWRHEALHRTILRNYAPRIKSYQVERDAIEDRFIAGALELQAASTEERARFSTDCFSEARQAETRWQNQVQSTPVNRLRPILSEIAWNGFNKAAGMD